MRSPQLEAYLSQSSILENGNGSAEVCQTESRGNNVESNSANLYYQAQKLISLCGWEPRSLPYMVDCKEGANHVFKDANIPQSSRVIAMEANESSQAHMTQSDPKSVVLDCRLCGASVGLWAFSMVARPVEFFRLVGYTEVHGENNSRTVDEGNNNSVDGGCGCGCDLLNISDSTPSKTESLPNLSRTIAGSPPPTKQNFKATISLPVIGQNLRARFSSEFGLNSTERDGSGQVLQTLKRKLDDQEHVTCRSDDQDPTDDTSETDATVREGNTGNLVECRVLTEKAEIIGTVSSTVEDHHKVKDTTNGSINSGAQNTLAVQIDKEAVTLIGETDMKQLPANTEMKFDPIKQRRHFCPWITPTGSGQPGWKQTLSALQRQKAHSHTSSPGSPPSDSMIKVDDPICSIRKLFMSPTWKKD